MSESPPPSIRTTGSREAYRSPWMTVREDAIEYADGTPGTYSVLVRTDFAMVVPVERDGFWLVEEYRHPIGRRIWNFPQGTWPQGHSGTQQELAAAELREETGLRPGRLEHLGRLFTAVGYSDQAYDVYLATELTPGPTDREPGEQGMVCEWWSETDVREMVASGAFADAHSVAALTLVDEHRRAGRM